MNPVDQITLDYLTNREMRRQLPAKKEKPVDRSDRKFYRRRVVSLTKDLLTNNAPADLLPDVRSAYENYLRACVGYFRIKDETDILQSTYPPTIMLEDDDDDEDGDFGDFEITKEEADKLMMRSIKVNNNTLDKFVTVRNVRPEEEMILPQQRQVDLTDPSLKTKGIRKKNNIAAPIVVEEVEVDEKQDPEIQEEEVIQNDAKNQNQGGRKKANKKGNNKNNKSAFQFPEIAV